MEIITELQKVRSKEKNAESVVKEIELQQEELLKKLHIFKSIQIASLFEEMLENRLFQRYGIAAIKICYNYDYDIGNEIAFSIYDCNGEEINKYASVTYLEPLDKLEKAFRILDGFSNVSISEDFNLKKVAVFKFDENLPSNILDLFLSKEFKAIISYNELENDLPKKNIIAKKIKV